jgi:nicotinamide-nucleotide adenylyltransferase
MNALFIGRFQPFHNGHAQVLQHVCNNYGEIIIGIGSSQYGHTLENPFTADERKRMMEQSLGELSIKNYRIVFIPDIHNPPKWVAHVLSIVSDFEVVLSNNKLTKRLFSEKGYSVKETPIYERDTYSGKEIRRRMINDEQWETLVPKVVYKMIQEIDGVHRLTELAARC